MYCDSPKSGARSVTYRLPSLEKAAIFNLSRKMEEAGGNINADFGKYYTSSTEKSELYLNVL